MNAALLGEACTVQWWYSVPHLRNKTRKTEFSCSVSLHWTGFSMNETKCSLSWHWTKLKIFERERVSQALSKERVMRVEVETQKIHKILTKPKIRISKPKLKDRHLSCISLQTSKRVGFDGLVKGLGFLSLV